MFTNEEKKQFQHCTLEEQQEIFEAFQKQITKLEIWSIMFQKWSKVISNLDREGIYRVVPQEEEDTFEIATPIKGIPWEVIDSRWNWAAMDEDGDLRLFKELPDIEINYWNTTKGCSSIDDVFKIDLSGVEWDTSLTKRPEYC